MWLASVPSRLRKTLAIALALGGLGAAAAYLTTRPEPEAVRRLEEVERAGERAGAQTDAIVRNLERIAGNLEPGAGLEAQSGEIHGLTERQRRSLEDLVEILREQLRALSRTKERLSGAQESTSGIVDIGRRQAALLRRSVAALEELERYAREASRFSGTLALQARYGARLAEDSARRFRRP